MKRANLNGRITPIKLARQLNSITISPFKTNNNEFESTYALCKTRIKEDILFFLHFECCYFDWVGRFSWNSSTLKGLNLPRQSINSRFRLFSDIGLFFVNGKVFRALNVYVCLSTRIKLHRICVRRDRNGDWSTAIKSLEGNGHLSGMELLGAVLCVGESVLNWTTLKKIFL